MIVENIIPRNMIINLGCASVDNHIPRDDIFDYHPLRECNIYILFITCKIYKILLFILIILLKVLHVWLPIKLGFWEVCDYWWHRQQVAIFVWDFRGQLEHRKRGFLNLALVMWRGFTWIKARICQYFLFMWLYISNMPTSDICVIIAYTRIDDLTVVYQ